MNKILMVILLISVIALFLVGCVKKTQEQDLADELSGPEENPQQEPIKEVIGTEEMGGKYNLTIVKTQITVGNRSGVMNMLRYEKDGKIIEPDVMLMDDSRPALDWLRENTNVDDIITAWWDYGHMIRAYSEREPIIDGPSKEILTTTVAKHIGKDPEDVDCPDCISHEIIQDVASILTAESSESVKSIMQKHNSDYLFVHSSDIQKAYAFFVSLDKKPLEFDSDEISELIIGKAANAEPIEGFKLVYSDDAARIYKII